MDSKLLSASNTTTAINTTTSTNTATNEDLKLKIDETSPNCPSASNYPAFSNENIQLLQFPTAIKCHLNTNFDAENTVPRPAPLIAAPCSTYSQSNYFGDKGDIKKSSIACRSGDDLASLHTCISNSSDYYVEYSDYGSDDKSGISPSSSSTLSTSSISSLPSSSPLSDSTRCFNGEISEDTIFRQSNQDINTTTTISGTGSNSSDGSNDFSQDVRSNSSSFDSSSICGSSSNGRGGVCDSNCIGGYMRADKVYEPLTRSSLCSSSSLCASALSLPSIRTQTGLPPFSTTTAAITSSDIDSLNSHREYDTSSALMSSPIVRNTSRLCSRRSYLGEETVADRGISTGNRIAVCVGYRGYKNCDDNINSYNNLGSTHTSNISIEVPNQSDNEAGESSPRILRHAHQQMSHYRYLPPLASIDMSRSNEDRAFGSSSSNSRNSSSVDSSSIDTKSSGNSRNSSGNSSGNSSSSGTSSSSSSNICNELKQVSSQAVNRVRYDRYMNKCLSTDEIDTEDCKNRYTWGPQVASKLRIGNLIYNGFTSNSSISSISSSNNSISSSNSSISRSNRSIGSSNSSISSCSDPNSYSRGSRCSQPDSSTSGTYTTYNGSYTDSHSSSNSNNSDDNISNDSYGTVNDSNSNYSSSGTSRCRTLASSTAVSSRSSSSNSSSTNNSSSLDEIDNARAIVSHTDSSDPNRTDRSEANFLDCLSYSGEKCDGTSNYNTLDNTSIIDNARSNGSLLPTTLRRYLSTTTTTTTSISNIPNAYRLTPPDASLQPKTIDCEHIHNSHKNPSTRAHISVSNVPASMRRLLPSLPPAEKDYRLLNTVDTESGSFQSRVVGPDSARYSTNNTMKYTSSESSDNSSSSPNKSSTNSSSPVSLSLPPHYPMKYEGTNNYANTLYPSASTLARLSNEIDPVPSYLPHSISYYPDSYDSQMSISYEAANYTVSVRTAVIGCFTCKRVNDCHHIYYFKPKWLRYTMRKPFVVGRSLTIRWRKWAKGGTQGKGGKESVMAAFYSIDDLSENSDNENGNGSSDGSGSNSNYGLKRRGSVRNIRKKRYVVEDSNRGSINKISTDSDNTDISDNEEVNYCYQRNKSDLGSNTNFITKASSANRSSEWINKSNTQPSDTGSKSCVRPPCPSAYPAYPSPPLSLPSSSTPFSSTPTTTASTPSAPSFPQYNTSESTPSSTPSSSLTGLYPPLALYCGGSLVARPDKSMYGGEDSLFYDNISSSIGVADGVGAWASYGTTAGPLAMQLMNMSKNASINIKHNAFQSIIDQATENVRKQESEDNHSKAPSCNPKRTKPIGAENTKNSDGIKCTASDNSRRVVKDYKIPLLNYDIAKNYEFQLISDQLRNASLDVASHITASSHHTPKSPTPGIRLLSAPTPSLFSSPPPMASLSKLDITSSAGEYALCILRDGFNNTRTYGSTTAVVASVHPIEHMLGVAVFGDSKCMVLRFSQLYNGNNGGASTSSSNRTINTNSNADIEAVLTDESCSTNVNVHGNHVCKSCGKRVPLSGTRMKSGSDDNNNSQIPGCISSIESTGASSTGNGASATGNGVSDPTNTSSIFPTGVTCTKGDNSNSSTSGNGYAAGSSNSDSSSSVSSISSKSSVGGKRRSNSMAPFISYTNSNTSSYSCAIPSGNGISITDSRSNGDVSSRNSTNSSGSCMVRSNSVRTSNSRCTSNRGSLMMRYSTTVLKQLLNPNRKHNSINNSNNSITGSIDRTDATAIDYSSSNCINSSNSSSGDSISSCNISSSSSKGISSSSISSSSADNSSIRTSIGISGDKLIYDNVNDRCMTSDSIMYNSNKNTLTSIANINSLSQSYIPNSNYIDDTADYNTAATTTTSTLSSIKTETTTTSHLAPPTEFICACKRSAAIPSSDDTGSNKNTMHYSANTYRDKTVPTPTNSTPKSNNSVDIAYISDAWEYHFNAPYQLYRLPCKNDRLALKDQGKYQVLHHLVDVIPRCPHVITPVECARISSVPIYEGDLLILGSDGLFDNLFTHTFMYLLKKAVSPIVAIHKYNDIQQTTNPQAVCAWVVRPSHEAYLSSYGCNTSSPELLNRVHSILSNNCFTNNTSSIYTQTSRGIQKGRGGRGAEVGKNLEGKGRSRAMHNSNDNGMIHSQSLLS